VADQPNIRFYAAAPVELSDGSRVGTLCVIDSAPRLLTQAQRDVLSSLATAASQALEGHHAIRRTRQLAGELSEQHELLRVTMQAIGKAVITTNAQAGVVWMNPVAVFIEGPIDRSQARVSKTPSFLCSGDSSAMKKKAGAVAERLFSVTAL
jgi:hypothetical protein